MDFKERAEKLTQIIESCWDENNPNDGLTFDERLSQKLEELEDLELKEMGQNIMDSEKEDDDVLYVGTECLEMRED